MIPCQEATLEWMRGPGSQGFPWSPERQRINALFPEQNLLKKARPFYDLERGRPSEAPLLLTKILFLSFFMMSGVRRTPWIR
jgi:hypothetical protein